MLCPMEILCISLLSGNSLSFPSGLEAALSFPDILFCLPCMWMFSNHEKVLQGCCSTLSKASVPSGLWHFGKKTKTKPRKPIILHHRAAVETVDNYPGQICTKQHRMQFLIYSQALPGISGWGICYLKELCLLLAVECWCFCIWSKPHDLSEKLN